jgi:hypothetical protein
MTDKLKEALADLSRTMKDIREGNTPFPSGRQDGDFFSFPTPGREPIAQDPEAANKGRKPVKA